MTRQTFHRDRTIWAYVRFPICLLVAVMLEACGSGDSNDGRKIYPQQTISGTAATGAPVANGQLTLKCAGEATNTILTYYEVTDENGAYSKSIDAAFAPCVISIDFTDNSGDSQTLSSYAKNLSSNTIANITPLTDAVLSSMMSTPLSTHTLTLGGKNRLNTLKTALEEGKEQTVWQVLKNNLNIKGLDTSVIEEHPVSDIFSADATHIGQGYDKLLDDLKIRNLEAPQLYQLAGGGDRFESIAQTNDTEVHDKLTGLIWQRCVVGKFWNGSTCAGTQTLMYWVDLPQLLSSTPVSPAPDAKAWRLPTLRELASLHDSYATRSPYIVDKAWFPATPAYWTWTVTPPVTQGPTVQAKIIGFQRSTIGSFAGENTDQLVVRLVR